MTSRTKRRLAVLALALGLIAAAPYVFDVFTERPTHFAFGFIEWTVEDNVAMSSDGLRTNAVRLRMGPWAGTFFPFRNTTLLVWSGFGFPPIGRTIVLPPASITLRVACAVALAGTWGLVAGGTLLARRWRRSDTSEPAAD